MYKKILATAILLCSLPVVANAAWFFNTWAKTQGGNISSRNGVAQTSTAGSVFKSYTTSAALTASVNCNTGYTVSKITLNNVDVPAPACGYTNTTISGPSTQSLFATFLPIPLAINASVSGGGGSVTPTSVANIFTGSKLVAPMVFRFIPQAGYGVNTITFTGQSGTISSALPAAVGATVSVTYPTGTIIAGPISVQGTFITTTPIANAGTAQTVFPNTTVTLTGSGTNGLFSKWSSVSRPAGAAAIATTNGSYTFSFIPTVVGTYNFLYRIANTGRMAAARVNVTVTNSATVAVRDQCTTCHISNKVGGVGASLAMFNEWSTSKHNNSFHVVMCYSCHVNANSGGHPGIALSTIYNQCIGCHSPYGPYVSNWQKSSHNMANNGFEQVACPQCHNPHSTQATFGAGTATGCQTCHAPGGKYGIYNADLTIRQPHGIANTTAFSAYSSGSRWIKVVFMSPAAGEAGQNVTDCATCHGHNNTVNAAWYEGGHGYNGETPGKAFRFNHENGSVKAVNWQNSPQASRCSSCHTANGYAAFADSGFTNISAYRNTKTYNNVTLPDGRVRNVNVYTALTCNGCHTSPEGALRNTKQYTNYNGYSTVAIVKKKLITTEVFPNWNASNTCIPCHTEGKGSGTRMVKKMFAADTPVFMQYSAGSVGIHALPAAGVVNATTGYDFTSAQGYVNRMKHASVGLANYRNTGTSGPCVACHFTKTGATHSLEAVSYDATSGAINGIVSTTCAKCHPSNFTYQDVATAKADFQAALKVLGNLLVSRNLGTLATDGTGKLTAKKLMDPNRSTGPGSVSEKNMGAIANYMLFTNAEAETGAYVHNAAWSRKLVFDSIDWLDDNIMNGSSGKTILAMGGATPGTGQAAVTTGEATAAAKYTTDPGCLGCHFGSGMNPGSQTSAGEDIPGIETTPHFNLTGALVPGHDFTQAQFVVTGTQCNYCHGIGHGSDSPGTKNGTPVIAAYAESAHGSINGLAWTDYNFLNLASRSACTPCHTTQGYVNAVTSANANGTGTYSTPAFIGNAADATKQVLGCNACHSSTSWATSVRTVTGGYTLAAVAASTSTDGTASGEKRTIGRAAVTFPPAGESDTCIVCHSGRVTGDEITAAVAGGANFANISFKNSHYMAAAGIMYLKAGFHNFTTLTAPVGTTTYGNTFSLKLDATQANGYPYNGTVDAAHGGIAAGQTSTHRALGTPTVRGRESWMQLGTDVQGPFETKGPCVTCHVNADLTNMPAATDIALAPFLPAGTVIPATRAGAGHTFEGASADASKQSCMPCHNDAGDFNTALNAGDFAAAAEEKLAEAKPYFLAGLDAIKNILENVYAIKYNPGSNPYFFEMDGTTAVTDWTRNGKGTLPNGLTVLDTMQAARLMGACFNLNVLTRDPGAYVHGRSYTQRLIFDSIDYLNNLQIDRDAAATLMAINPTLFPDTNDHWLYKAGGARK